MKERYNLFTLILFIENRRSSVYGPQYLK